MMELGYLEDGRIVERDVEEWDKWGYLLVYVPKGLAIFRNENFANETAFRNCIDRWNEMGHTHEGKALWLHIPLDEIEGWDIVL